MVKACSDCGMLPKPNESCACPKKKKIRKQPRWDEVRTEIKPWFEREGYVHCELKLSGCNEAIGTGFAHAKQRRHLADKELYIVAYLCNNCHNKIEGKTFMAQTVLNIRKRNSIPEIDRIINEYYGNN